jgi:ubiquitin-protein ligase
MDITDNLATLVETSNNNDIINYDLVINDIIFKLVYLKSNKIYLVEDKNNDNDNYNYNYNLILINKINPSKKELIDIFNKEKKVEKPIENIYNLNRTSIYNKYFIDFDKIYLLTKFDKTKVFSNNNFEPKMIFEIVKKDILSVNQEVNNKYYIKLDENVDNCYNLELVIVYDDNNKIMKKLKELNHNSINFKLILDKLEYPFKVPELKLVSKIFKNEVIFQFNNLKEFKQNNWNPLVSIKYIIEKLADEIENKCYEYLMVENDNDINNLILELALLTNYEVSKQIISLDFDKVNYNKEKLRWNAGTGYGHEGLAKWDINKFTKEKEDINSKLEYLLIQINGLIKNININDININDILKLYLLNSLQGVNLLEIQEKTSIYIEIFKAIRELLNLNIISKNDISKVYDNLMDLKEAITHVLQNIEMDKKDMSLLKINEIIDFIVNNVKINNDKSNNNININNLKENYVNMVKNNMFDDYEVPSYYNKFDKDNTKLSKQSMVRIMSEIQGFKKNLPVDWDTSILFRYSKKNIQSCSFYVIGPKDTPYHNGIFEFNMFFPHNYPNDPPKVLLLTTGNGKVRFNPNLYNCGKVCLSLLGTWSGQEGEKWNPKISTALQVLISIQSLIFIEEPYFNEPGYENSRNTINGKNSSKEYNELRRLETIRWAINDKIKNPPEAIKDFVKQHFEMKKDELKEITQKWIDEAGLYKVKMVELRDEMLSLI